MVSKKFYAENVRLKPANATCGICYEEMSLLTVNIHDINPCNFHCCEQCAFTYLAQKIKEKDISSASLTCPSCREPLTSTDVHRVLDAVRIQEHQDEKAKLLVMFDEAFEVQSKVDKEKNRRLQRRFPSVREVASDVALSCWSMGAHTRRCPGCRNLIEKNGGCQHMTCRTCRHEFWWCCGQSYGNSNHNEVLCLPFVYMNHQSRYWGPNVLVRTVTKTAVLGVGVGIAATAAGVAAVALPTAYIMKKCANVSRMKKWRIRRAARVGVVPSGSLSSSGSEGSNELGSVESWIQAAVPRLATTWQTSIANEDSRMGSFLSRGDFNSKKESRSFSSGELQIVDIESSFTSLGSSPRKEAIRGREAIKSRCSSFSCWSTDHSSDKVNSVSTTGTSVSTLSDKIATSASSTTGASSLLRSLPEQIEHHLSNTVRSGRFGEETIGNSICLSTFDSVEFKTQFDSDNEDDTSSDYDLEISKKRITIGGSPLSISLLTPSSQTAPVNNFDFDHPSIMESMQSYNF